MYEGSDISTSLPNYRKVEIFKLGFEKQIKMCQWEEVMKFPGRRSRWTEAKRYGSVGFISTKPMLQVTLCAVGRNMDLIPSLQGPFRDLWGQDLERYRLENSDGSVDSGLKESCSGPVKANEHLG